MGALDALATLVNFGANKLSKNDDVSGIFLDETKVFDFINHDVLLHKLYGHGFRCVVHQWFTSYIKNRVQ